MTKVFARIATFVLGKNTDRVVLAVAVPIESSERIEYFSWISLWVVLVDKLAAYNLSVSNVMVRCVDHRYRADMTKEYVAFGDGLSKAYLKALKDSNNKATIYSISLSLYDRSGALARILKANPSNSVLSKLESEIRSALNVKYGGKHLIEIANLNYSLSVKVMSVVERRSKCVSVLSERASV
jgi:hypothetical protein